MELATIVTAATEEYLVPNPFGRLAPAFAELLYVP